MTPTYPFSEETQIVLRYAYQLAQDYQHLVVYPEHVLLSISAYRNYRAYHLLSALNVNMEEMGKQCQISIAKHNAMMGVSEGKQVQVSGAVQQAMHEGANVAYIQQKPFGDTGYLLLGLLKPGLDTATILQAQGITPDKIHNLLLSDRELPAETAVTAPKPKAKPVKLPYKFQVSPVFLVILAITILAGVSAYFDWLSPGLSVFFFVTGGWVVSLCLHEFGHALVAYWAGDDTVVEKGYLTLNPVKYTHGMMSIVLPLIIVMMGGIGLPGGAVYINRSLIREKYKHSLVSAAGPFATGCVALLLAIPFFLDLASFEHATFWGAIAMLAFLQLTALFFNLLPLPGLDGFGIIAPYLPEDILRLAYTLGQFTYILIIILFFYFEPFQTWFFGNILTITNFIGIDRYFLGAGFELFRFWAQ